MKSDLNSSTNQEIKGKFVAREVKTCFSYEMEAVLRAGAEGRGLSDTSADYPLPNYEDIENLYEYRCPDCGKGFTTLEELSKDGEKPFDCPSCKAHFNEEPEQEAQEIYEWWVVSNWLYEKLKAKGHPVLEWGNNYYWGRCTTGQAILLDGVISDICSEMEILEGQKYDWSK